MNDTQKYWANARQRFFDEWAVMTFYERFQEVVALIPANVIAVIIVISLSTHPRGGRAARRRRF